MFPLFRVSAFVLELVESQLWQSVGSLDLNYVCSVFFQQSTFAVVVVVVHHVEVLNLVKFQLCCTVIGFLVGVAQWIISKDQSFWPLWRAFKILLVSRDRGGDSSAFGTAWGWHRRGGCGIRTIFESKGGKLWWMKICHLRVN